MSNYPLISDEYLAHIGRSKADGAKVGSGRYPLGSGKNPRAQRRAEKQQARQQKKAEKGKQEALNSGDPRQVKKYQHLMTQAELQQAISRIEKNQRLDQLSAQQMRQMTDAEVAITNVLNHIGTVSGWIGTVATAEQNINNVYTQSSQMLGNYRHAKKKQFGLTGNQLGGGKKNK